MSQRSFTVSLWGPVAGVFLVPERRLRMADLLSCLNSGAKAIWGGPALWIGRDLMPGGVALFSGEERGLMLVAAESSRRGFIVPGK